MSREGMETRPPDRSPRADRFVGLGMLLVGLMAAPDRAEAGDSRGTDNAWAQLMGENTEERAEELKDLERECLLLEKRIAELERRVGDSSMRYTQNPGLKFEEQGELRDAERELARKRAAIERLQKGGERGAERAVESRAARSERVEGTRLEFTDPTLDLSPGKVGSPDVAGYYGAHGISFQDHQLFFNAEDGQRLCLTVRPEFTDADFFLADKGKDLLVVMTTVTGGHKTLKFDDGSFGGFYDSDAHGKPVPADFDE